MRNEFVTGWLCLRCCRRLINVIAPEQHCPCSDDPVRIRMRVLRPGTTDHVDPIDDDQDRRAAA